MKDILNLIDIKRKNKKRVMKNDDMRNFSNINSSLNEDLSWREEDDGERIIYFTDVYPFLSRNTTMNKSGIKKPELSYEQLIINALLESNHYQATLAEIYIKIIDRYDFFKNNNGTWKGSIRHNLTLSKYVNRLPKNKNSPGKGGIWVLDYEKYNMEKDNFKLSKNLIRWKNNETLKSRRRSPKKFYELIYKNVKMPKNIDLNEFNHTKKELEDLIPDSCGIDMNFFN